MESTLQELDAELVRTAKGLHVLTHLSWDASTQTTFLSGWAKGSPSLPQVGYPPLEIAETLRALERIANQAARFDSAIGTYLQETARSYLDIGRLMERAGTREAGEISLQVYGRPGDPLPGSSANNLDAARYFIATSRAYEQACADDAADYCLTGQMVADAMASRIGAVITDGIVRISVDAALASKAAAGATRVRLREGTFFSEFDVEQLLQHEVFVHSLTALNGRAQPRLASLSLGAPRTTATQEGLATFAELVTGAMEIQRMERIALRILAIDAALSGADFVEVFRLFLDSGQPEIECFNSTMRIFRGVPVDGGAAFAKDGVYLHGLLEVHTFFRWALQNQRLELCDHLLAGRMTLSDVFALESCFASGELVGPRYRPPWMTRTNGLTAYLAFSVFANSISIDDVVPDAFTRVVAGAAGPRPLR